MSSNLLLVAFMTDPLLTITQLPSHTISHLVTQIALSKALATTSLRYIVLFLSSQELNV